MADWWAQDQAEEATGDWWADDVTDSVDRRFGTGEPQVTPAASEFIDVYDMRGEFLHKRRRTENELTRLPQDVEYMEMVTPDGQRVKMRPKGRRDIARERGLTDAEGGSIPSRLAESAGSAEDIKRQLAIQFDIDPDEVQIGEMKGIGTVFMNPTTGKFEPLDPVGGDLGDVATIIPEALVIGGEIAGGIAGARAGPMGVAAGAAAGAGITRGAIIGGLEATGVLEDPDYIAPVATEMALAAAGGVAPSVGRRVAQAVKPTEPALLRIDPTLGKGAPGSRVAEFIEQGEREAAELGVPMTTGQMVSAVPGGKELGKRLVATERAAVDRGPYVEIAQRQRDVRSQIMEDLQPRELVDELEVGAEISQAAHRDLLGKQADIADEIGREIARFDQNLVDLMPSTGGEAASIRTIMQEGRDNVFEVLSKGYNELWEQVPEDTLADITGIKAVADRYKTKIKKRVFKSLTEENKKLIQDVFDHSENAGDLVALSEDLSDLKAMARRLDILPAQQRMLDDFIFETGIAREEALGAINPALATQIRSLDRAYQSAKSSLDEGLVGDILKRKKGGRYKIADDQILRSATRNTDELRAYIDATRDYPQVNAIDDLKGAFRYRYKDEVIDGSTEHFTWVRRNRQAMQEIFTPKEMEVFSSAAGVQRAIDASEKRLKEQLSGLTKMTGGKVSHYSPVEAVKATMGSASNAADMKKILNPDQWASYQGVRRQKLVESIIKDDDISYSALDKALRGKSRAELKESLGERYVRDLDQVKNIMRAGRRKGADKLQMEPSPTDEFATIKGLIFGPLTRAGFRIGKVQRYASGRINTIVEDLLSDPKKLKDMLQLKDASIRSRKWWNLMGALGFNVATIMNDHPDPNIPVMKEAP